MSLKSFRNLVRLDVAAFGGDVVERFEEEVEAFGSQLTSAPETRIERIEKFWFQTKKEILVKYGHDFYRHILQASQRASQQPFS
jgi:hypothetical protein